jgi:hypothetical protein
MVDGPVHRRHPDEGQDPLDATLMARPRIKARFRHAADAARMDPGLRRDDEKTWKREGPPRWPHPATHAMRAASFQHEQGRPSMIASRKRRPRTGTGLA